MEFRCGVPKDLKSEHPLFSGFWEEDHCKHVHTPDFAKARPSLDPAEPFCLLVILQACSH